MFGISKFKSWINDMRVRAWQAVVCSKLYNNITKAVTYLSLAFSSSCFCFSSIYGAPLFTAMSFIASVAILINLDLVKSNSKYRKYADLYKSMMGISDDIKDSSGDLKDSNKRLKKEVDLLQGKIKKLEGLLLGMEKIINDSHNLNEEQASAFKSTLEAIIASADITNSAAKEEFAKVLINYEGVSDKLFKATSELEQKTSELERTNAALCNTNTDFKKVCASLEKITLKLEQLYNIGVISERRLNDWSSQARMSAVSSSDFAKCSKSSFVGLQDFCNSLSDMPVNSENTFVGA